MTGGAFGAAGGAFGPAASMMLGSVPAHLQSLEPCSVLEPRCPCDSHSSRSTGWVFLGGTIERGLGPAILQSLSRMAYAIAESHSSSPAAAQASFHSKV